MIIGDIFERNARCARHSPAILFEGRTLTHGDLVLRARRMIRTLAARGLVKGDRIAVLSRNCPEYVELFAAASLAGYIVVGINYRLSEAEQRQLLLDCDPAAVFFEDEYEARMAALRPGLAERCLLVSIGRAARGCLEYEALVLEGEHAGRDPARSTEDDTLFLIYTSGTTGKPKGVMVTNGAQFEHGRIQAAARNPRPTDRMLIVMPFYHLGGTTELLTYVTAGATIVLHRVFDAAAILDDMERHGVTAAHFAPTMIQMLLDEQERSARDVSSLHTIIYASAPMSVALLRRGLSVFGPVFLQAYGMTEHGPCSVLLPHQHHAEGTDQEIARLASAGQPLLGVEVRILDADGSECPTGKVGEIVLRSAAIMQGYWRDPETARVAMPDGWLHSGDVGYLDEDCFLFIVDRKKDMIISGGENIYSREVEEALQSHPAVLEAAVIGVPDEKWGESVKAFVALKGGAGATEAELIEHCRRLIASYKKPKSVEIISALPRTVSTNKVDKRQLREPYWRNAARKIS